MVKTHFDFETYSEADIRKVGAWAYSIHPSTRVLCAGYAHNDEPPQLWVPGQEMPKFLVAPCTHDQFHAWNSFFEWAIWKNVLKTHMPPLVQWYDTAALSSAMALPRALGYCGAALGVSEDKAKSRRGYELIKLLSKPNKMNDNPALLKEMYAYCMQDVVAERELSKKLFDLNPTERKVFILDQKINTTGIALDVESVDNAIEVYGHAYNSLMESLKDLTGLDNPNSAIQFFNWLTSKGHIIDNVQKATLQALLNLEDKYNTHTAIRMRMKLAKAAPKKYSAMRDRVGNGTRLHGNTMYHGASTGRWASTGVNLQNIARPTVDADESIALINTTEPAIFDMLDMDPMEALSSSIRGMLIPSKGKKFIIGDYASIESRALAWLAGQEDKLEVFRGHGKIYEHVAAKIYNIYSEHGQNAIELVTQPQRFVGKIGELACGFGGGAGAITGMAKIYKVDMTKPEAEKIKNDWRAENPEICQFWKTAENAAASAVAHPGEVFQAGRVKFMVAHNFLWCQLPSGRRLAYHRPFIKVETVTLIKVPATEDEGGYNIMYSPHEYTKEEFKALADAKGLTVESFDAPTIYFWGTDSQTRKWRVHSTYGGKLVENITQAVARDLMAESMLILDDMGYNIVLTVHDEIISEVPIDTPHDEQYSVEEFTTLMETTPTWADGLPVRVEAYEATRYRK
jgi:DNA polymerase bacteriophage-type